MTLAINDKVYIDIIENGYWKDSAKGKIVGETDKFWIVESGSHHFWDGERGYHAKRFSKTAGRVSRRG